MFTNFAKVSFILLSNDIVSINLFLLIVRCIQATSRSLVNSLLRYRKTSNIVCIVKGLEYWMDTGQIQMFSQVFDSRVPPQLRLQTNSVKVLVHLHVLLKPRTNYTTKELYLAIAADFVRMGWSQYLKKKKA